MPVAYRFLGLLGMLVCFTMAGCEKKSGAGVVIGKEYVPAVLATEESRKDEKLVEPQWKALVEMDSDMRKVHVLMEPAAWEKLKIGDRVQVRYAQGKYTGTIWSSDIKEDRK